MRSPGSPGGGSARRSRQVCLGRGDCSSGDRGSGYVWGQGEVGECGGHHGGVRSLVSSGGWSGWWDRRRATCPAPPVPPVVTGVLRWRAVVSRSAPGGDRVCIALRGGLVLPHRWPRRGRMTSRPPGTTMGPDKLSGPIQGSTVDHRAVGRRGEPPPGRVPVCSVGSVVRSVYRVEVAVRIASRIAAQGRSRSGADRGSCRGHTSSP